MDNLKVEMLRPTQIQVDRQYQRPLHRDHVTKIMRSFDPLAIGTVTVSQRDDGSYWVIDGQHRLAALIEMGRGDRPIPCVVYTGLSVGQEADKFFMQSRVRRIHPIDLFKARLFAGDPVAMGINKVVTGAGFKVEAGGKSDTHIQAPATLELIYTIHGPERLAEVLGMVGNIWSGQKRSVPQYIISGINAAITRYPRIDRDRLVRVLRETPAEDMERTAKAMRRFTNDRGATIYGRTMIHFYNKGLRQKLPDWDTTLEQVNAENLAKATEASAEARRGIERAVS